MAMVSPGPDCLNDASAFTASANNLMSNEIEKKGWYNLEPEVLAVIFKYLRWPDRFKLDQVSRHWRNVMKSKQFLNVGVVNWDEYSKRWPKLTFDRLIDNLAVVKQKIISGIEISSLIRPRIGHPIIYRIDYDELIDALVLIRSWDHFKVVRLHDVECLTAGFDYQINVLGRKAFNLEELMIVVRKLDCNKLKVDLSSFQYLNKLVLKNCFPVNAVGDCLTTLSIACNGLYSMYSRVVHDFDSITDLLISCSNTLCTLKLCHFVVVGSGISTSKRSIIFSRLEWLTIDNVQLNKCCLNIDLSESKLKHLNCVVCSYSEYQYMVDFKEIQNVLNSEIESLNIRLLSSHTTIVNIINIMRGSCYPKLCRLDLEAIDDIHAELLREDNESESIVASVLDLLDNAENFNYIRLPDLIRSSEQLIRLVIKMRSLKRSFQVEVGRIDDSDTSFWGKLLAQLTIEKLESNDCDGKIELKCLFDDKSDENDDLTGLLRDKFNVYCVDESRSRFVYPYSSDSDDDCLNSLI